MSTDLDPKPRPMLQVGNIGLYRSVTFRSSGSFGRSAGGGKYMPDELRGTTPPRARILAAARDLFHRRGLRGVGVDTIAEAAGTNKMTLYRHFESKDELIVAYLRGVAAEADAMWEAIRGGNPPERT